MATEIVDDQADPRTPASQVTLRLWPALTIVLLMWGVMIGSALLFPETMIQFMSAFMGPQVALLLMVLWWLFASRVPWRERLIGLAICAALIGAAVYFAHEKMPVVMLVKFAPLMLLGIVAVLLFGKSIDWKKRRWLPVGVIAIAAAIGLSLRLEGLDGAFNAEYTPRWAPSREESFLSRQAAGAQPAAESQLELPTELANTDWPEFRGTARDGRVTGVTFSTDWKATPPREVWRHEVGPGWSSFTVIDNTIFTQEQYGDQEVVTAYAADTGKLVWINEVESRFDEMIGGPGPRATPTYHEGKLYTQGANGKIQCLDAATGKTLWIRDLTVDTPAKPPVWGFSASPLVVDNLVITYAGAGDGKSVVAYQREDGEIAWMAGKGTHSYSSPQLATFDGVPQVLMLSNYGVISFSPAEGTELWEHEWDLGSQSNRVVQPMVLGNDVLIGTYLGMGTRRFSVTHEGETWNTTEEWTSRNMKPYFNDYVHHDGYLYGFDGKIFACISLEDGKKQWKRGRYGHGQVLLVEDMGALLVLGEAGELVLLEANPDKNVELAKIQALDGKTWNHPVISGTRLFVRNGNEAACYELDSGVLTANAAR